MIYVLGIWSYLYIACGGQKLTTDIFIKKKINCSNIIFQQK